MRLPLPLEGTGCRCATRMDPNGSYHSPGPSLEGREEG